MTIQFKDVGSYLAAATGFADGSATAGGSGDATYKAGAILDLLALDHPLSGAIVVPYTTTLAQDETLSLKVKIEHGDDSGLSDAADYTFGQPDGLAEYAEAVVATGGTGGSTEVGTEIYRYDLSGLKRYFRISVYPDLSASATDTATFAGALVLAGQASMP